MVSAAIAELGPRWYFVVRGGEVHWLVIDELGVSCEIVVEGR